LVRRVFFALAALLTLLYSAFIPQVFAATLIVAFGVRLAYVLLRWRSRRPLLSGWIFVIALGMLLDVAVTTPGPKIRRADAAAVRQGVVAKHAHVTPRDRCVGMLLDWWDRAGAQQSPDWTKPRYRAFVAGACGQAAEEHVLRSDGEIEPSAFDRIWYG
jgi:hypothetical protein